jgi:putative ABC transport system ATP-binding protein
MIVWADEPTGNLDSVNSDDIMNLLLRLNKENDQTFVIVTHDPGVGGVCKRVIEMEDGLITSERRGQQQ